MVRKTGKRSITGIITAHPLSQTTTAIETRILRKIKRKILRETKRIRKETRKSLREINIIAVVDQAVQNLRDQQLKESRLR